jgi:GxxExxY protein
VNQPLIYAEEAYAIIGKCMDVHRFLGHGFLEIVYKDALESEFGRAAIPYEREVKFEVRYRWGPLPHCFYADFTVLDKIILEVKSIEGLHDALYAQTLNYLKVSGYKLGLLVNFGKQSLEYKRLVLLSKVWPLITRLPAVGRNSHEMRIADLDQFVTIGGSLQPPIRENQCNSCPSSAPNS